VWAASRVVLTNDLDPTDLHDEYRRQGGVHIEAMVLRRR
jgi:hypothetical protein